MAALDPMLVCIAAAALVLLAHGIFALAKRNSGDGEPGAVTEGVATLLCGLAFIGPLAIVPFASGLNEALILLGTVFAVIASAIPIVVLPRRRVRSARAAEPLIVNRRVVQRRANTGPMRVVVPPGTDPAAAVRSAITGPIPRIPAPGERPAARPQTSSSARVAGPPRWTPPAPATAPPPPAPPATAQTETAPTDDAAPLPAVLREADKATKTLDEVDNTVLDVKTWLRLDR